MDKKITLWNGFCEEHGVVEKAVPLFKCDGLRVEIIPYGRDSRFVLKRSEEMEAFVIKEVEKVLLDFEQGRNSYEGLIYMMFRKEDKKIVPLYIGKSEKYGRKKGNLSENIRNIRVNRGKFCRWGYNYAYHMGDLSAVVCEGHTDKSKTTKYQKWGERLFQYVPSSEPMLKKPTYFWISAWKHGSVGPWREVGQISLTFLEYLLIGLASDAFPGVLLNEEGVNRT